MRTSYKREGRMEAAILPRIAGHANVRQEQICGENTERSAKWPRLAAGMRKRAADGENKA